MKISYRNLKNTEYEYKNVFVIYICFKMDDKT